jgi:Ricin-type beta-trefoil lectin domain-like
MKLKRPRLRAQAACALAALGTSALLAGGVLAPPAAASAGGARLAHLTHRPAQRPPNRSDHRAVPPTPAGQALVRVPKRPAGRAGLTKPSPRPATGLRKHFYPGEPEYDGWSITPNNTLFLQLDVGGASTSSGAGVIDWWTNGGANQKWDWVPADTNYDEWLIVNENSGQCLASDGIPGDQVYQEPCYQDSVNQYWSTTLPIDYQDYSLASSDTIENEASHLYLDVSGDSPWPGAWIDTWYYNGNPNQYFRID